MFILISRIRLWKILGYVSAGAAGASVFVMLVDRFPIERASDRMAA